MLITTTSAVLIASCALSPASWGCQCGLVPPPREALERMPAVFVGQVIGIWPRVAEIENVPGRWPVQTVTLRVLLSWKGAPGPTVLLRNDGSDCDFHFAVGTTYLVFAEPHPHDPSCLRTNKCTPTKRADDVLAVIADLPPPDEMAAAIPGLTESYARRAGRAAYACLLWGGLYTGNVTLGTALRRVVLFMVAALLAAVLGLPGIRSARRRPWVFFCYLLVIFVLASVALMLRGYFLIRSYPWIDFL